MPLQQLLEIALNSSESGWTEEDGNKQQLAERAVKILVDKAPIMCEYFSLRIDENGNLLTLPCLLKKHTPNTTYLPIYLLRLATEVEWDTEEECFETFCRETANFYAKIPQLEIENHPKKHTWMVEHIIYPAFKQYLLPPNRLKKQLYELTNLPTLYKVFERC